MKNDVSKGSHGKYMKNHSPSSNNYDDKAAKQSEFKGVRTPILALRAPTATGSDNSVDEAVLPLAKHQQKSLEVMSDSSNKTGKNSSN